MSDPDQKPDPSKVSPAPRSEAPGALKAKPPNSGKIVVVEVTKTGRAWTFLGTESPHRPR